MRDRRSVHFAVASGHSVADATAGRRPNGSEPAAVSCDSSTEPVPPGSALADGVPYQTSATSAMTRAEADMPMARADGDMTRHTQGLSEPLRAMALIICGQVKTQTITAF